MSTAIRSAELPLGVTLPYAEHGEPSGTPVVMLHGWSDSWRSFEGVLPYLPPSIRALSLTQRGHGDAARPESYAVSDLSGDVVAFLDALELDSVVIAGHSMGTTVAERVAIDHPDRVAGLVLIGAQPTFAGLHELFAAVAQLTDPVDVDFIREFQESTVARPVAPGLLEMAIAESAKLPARVWHRSMDGTLRADFSDELASVGAPTLIIAGERDDIAPPDAAEELRSLIPGARLVVHADAGHAIHWEDPAGIAAELTSFVRDAAPVAT
jgi:pimeloyl-ACP methyl ester carboxylesterase